MRYWGGMPELVEWTATQMAAAVAANEVSAVELVTAHLARIARLEPLLNAFVDLRPEAALAEAAEHDARAATGHPRGPLGGVPVTVKSAIEVRGLRCETGSASRRDVRAASDASVVQRLRAAGAIVLGTTNVAEMLMAYDTDNPLHGRTNNPWDLTRTPGGSSGGEAAAIAAGCSAGGVGSDGGGSIRVPAHFTGLCGLKPTPGRVPATGHQPPCLGPFSLIGVVGPMARTVADVALLYRAIAGWDLDDPMATPMPAVPATSWPRPRVAWFDAHPVAPPTAETRAAVAAAVRALDAQHYVTRAHRPASLDRALPLWDVFFGDAGEALLAAALAGRERHLPIVAALHEERGPRAALTAPALLQAWIERDLVRAALLDEMREHDVIVCPVAARPAFAHGERAWRIDGHDVGYLDAMAYTQWFNILGNPAAVVRAGWSHDGMPIGVQVVGRPFEEHLVLDVAAAIERGCGGWVAPPMTGQAA